VQNGKKKENDAICALALQTYTQTTNNLKLIKITALVGESALKDATSNDAFEKMQRLVTNTEKMCDYILQEREKALAASTESCTEKSQVRAITALADVQVSPNGFSCANLFRQAKLMKL
jgi:hypothetical protein